MSDDQKSDNVLNDFHVIVLNVIELYDCYGRSSVQYFLENVLLDVQNPIYGISIVFKCGLNTHF